jgi:hypothetical protein
MNKNNGYILNLILFDGKAMILDLDEQLEWRAV